jgi:hypothetical protein
MEQKISKKKNDEKGIENKCEWGKFPFLNQLQLGDDKIVADFAHTKNFRCMNEGFFESNVFFISFEHKINKSTIINKSFPFL